MCLGTWAEANVFDILSGGMWGEGVEGGLTKADSAGWGQVGPLITVLGAKVTMGVPELELAT